jgi:hypothetical protein
VTVGPFDPRQVCVLGPDLWEAWSELRVLERDPTEALTRRADPWDGLIRLLTGGQHVLEIDVPLDAAAHRRREGHCSLRLTGPTLQNDRPTGLSSPDGD